jgi:hypothetical protein
MMEKAVIQVVKHVGEDEMTAIGAIEPTGNPRIKVIVEVKGLEARIRECLKSQENAIYIGVLASRVPRVI